MEIMLHHPKGWGMLLAIQCQRADHSRSKTRNMGATGRLSDALQGMSSARLETDAMQKVQTISGCRTLQAT